VLSGVKLENPNLKIMAGDESFFRGETPLTHTWGDTKQRKSIKVSSHYGTIGVLGAVDPKDGEHFELVIDNGSIDSEVVNIFLHKLAEKYKNENILLLLDNASYHKTQGSKKYPIPGNISIMFLPPYSPDLNPQENVWKIVKEAKFKNILCRNREELLKTVINAFKSYKNHKFLVTKL